MSKALDQLYVAAVRVGIDPLTGRALTGRGLKDTERRCPRCSGSGHWVEKHEACFRCKGTGKILKSTFKGAR